MALDLAAWAVIFVAVRVVGRGALALLDADDIRARPELVVRAGDRLILAAWIGVIVCAITLLGVSLFTALTPIVSASVAVVLCALGALALWRAPTRLPPRASILALPTWAIVPGVAAVAVGAAALASDPVTLYDSLVYHVGLIRWLREAGTVPGMALIHNRLGHVSAWFTIAAAFDSGSVANRASNIPLGFALVLTGIQTGIATARIAASRAVIADWFLALGSAALIWAIVVGRAASPSPDVATNALILVAAWAVLVVSPGPTSFTRRLIPFVIALGACSMKLFAVPAVIVTGAYALRVAKRWRRSSVSPACPGLRGPRHVDCRPVHRGESGRLRVPGLSVADRVSRCAVVHRRLTRCGLCSLCPRRCPMAAAWRVAKRFDRLDRAVDHRSSVDRARHRDLFSARDPRRSARGVDA
jgi:hypothetical protein